MSDTPNPSENPAEEPKIIIDDDWKEQVAKEKEAAAAKGNEPVEPVESEPADEPVAAPEELSADKDAAADEASGAQAPPPASFEVLVSMLFTQAMMMLGQMPDPATGKANINKPFAKHYIDTLDMLSEKTKGNLSENEAKMLSEALHAMRMMYVNVKAS
ncbi:hypothetical protein CA13_45080 [Planctomycetes bacterium CA13]|uniref:DUF1844 domain-containing protein n=1 Tax=Novipirellula herctigrandis TaxID=2527986 RepID=A0A5C5Z746_9BACT|nr:hypothetical protein CA13_45080 [Planctomycetes bacterium CA13]